MLRETYNADLRVIRPSGQGTAAAYRVSELTHELEQFLATNLVLAVAVTGDQAEPAQRALMEGLLKEGLQVTSRPWGEDRSIDGDSSGPSPELLVRGVVRVWPIDVRDPQFKFMRWCSDFEVVDLASQRVVGALSKGGKEGHLSEREATAKVVRVMQQEFSADMAKAIAAHVYGESELPAQVSSACGMSAGWAGIYAGVSTPLIQREREDMAKSKSEAEHTSTRAPRSRGRGLTVTQQRVPSRLAKRRLNERLKNDTASFNQGNLADKFRKEGYDELPLDELQDRLSKLSGPLAAIILKGRV